MLTTAGGKVLIDAGFSGRRICHLLEEVGERPESIDAVFITHEHNDHAKGLLGLSRFKHLKVFANRETARAVQAGVNRRLNWQLFETGAPFTHRDLTVHPFAVPHDAYDPVGFLFQVGQEDDLFTPARRLAWATDLGYAPELVRQHIGSADVVVLEANHDEDLLDRDEKRPWSVKQRIRGRHGHLSNSAARQLLDSVIAPKWQHIFLAHLSRDCNSTEAVRAFFDPPAPNGHAYPCTLIDPANGVTPAFAV